MMRGNTISSARMWGNVVILYSYNINVTVDVFDWKPYYIIVSHFSDLYIIIVISEDDYTTLPHTATRVPYIVAAETL